MHYREIPFGRQSYLELREEIAHKFDCKPVQVAQVFKEPDILVADDDDVSRLRPGTVLEVNIDKRGKKAARRVASAAAVTTTASAQTSRSRAFVGEPFFIHREARSVSSFTSCLSLASYRRFSKRTPTPSREIGARLLRQRNVRRKNNTLPVGGLSGDTTCKNTI